MFRFALLACSSHAFPNHRDITKSPRYVGRLHDPLVAHWACGAAAPEQLPAFGNFTDYLHLIRLENGPQRFMDRTVDSACFGSASDLFDNLDSNLDPVSQRWRSSLGRPALTSTKSEEFLSGLQTPLGLLNMGVHRRNLFRVCRGGFKPAAQLDITPPIRNPWPRPLVVRFR